jgi:hypothetical protein
LAAAIAVVDEPAAMDRPALIQSLFKSIEDERGMSGAADPPADDVSGKDVDDEGNIDETLPGREWSRKRLRASPPRTVRTRGRKSLYPAILPYACSLFPGSSPAWQ